LAEDSGSANLGSNPSLGLAYKAFVVVCVFVTLVGELVAHPQALHPELALWAVAVAVVELLPVDGWRGLRLSLSFPILVGVAMLYSPPIAAAVTLVGLFDAREVKRELPIMTALFNRCQVAAAILLASLTFHGLAGSGVRSTWYVLLAAGALATACAYAANVVLVSIYMRLIYGVSLGDLVAQLRVGALSEFLLSYLGLGLVGVVMARLYIGVGFWAVAAFIAPLVFARQLFFRMKALEEASIELKDRERVMRALSNRMAEERLDERVQIAGYLHDDLAQTLFRLTLQIEMAKKRLSHGDVEGVNRHLDNISETKQQTSDMIRALIKDLHRSPIGRTGLGDAIFSFAHDMTRDSPVRVAVDVVEVSLPPPIQLLIYQIAREAVTNSLKHASPKHLWISLHERDDGVELQVRDDGTGFDASAPGPDGHFGAVMMRERALVAGGTFSVDSSVGRGTAITATFPRVWVEEGTELEAQQALASAPAGEPKKPLQSPPSTDSTPEPPHESDAIRSQEEPEAGGSRRRAISA
jgi:signal transduction histidine kinase